MSLALQHGVLYHVNGLFIIHVSEERHGGAEFFFVQEDNVLARFELGPTI